jgi:hypothetical protein
MTSPKIVPQIIGPVEQEREPACMDEDSDVVWPEPASPDIIDDRGERLTGIDRVEQQPVCSGGEPHRLQTSLGGNPVLVADVIVPIIDVVCGDVQVESEEARGLVHQTRDRLPGLSLRVMHCGSCHLDWQSQRADGEFRTYRVSRIRDAALTEDAFDRPDGFDLAEHWERINEQYFTSLRDYPVRLRVRGTVGHRLRWAPNAKIDYASERTDGWWDVTMTFEKAYEARVYLLGLAGYIVVLEPAELRDDMCTAARTLLTTHDPR